MLALPSTLGWFSPGSPARSSQFDVDLIDAWDTISNTVPTARWLPSLPDEWKVHGTLLHHTDVVIDDQHKLVFIDNVKAASTTVRQIMSATLGVSWETVRAHCPPPTHSP
jgi:hypothetical protein